MNNLNFHPSSQLNTNFELLKSCPMFCVSFLNIIQTVVFLAIVIHFGPTSYWKIRSLDYLEKVPNLGLFQNIKSWD